MTCWRRSASWQTEHVSGLLLPDCEPATRVNGVKAPRAESGGREGCVFGCTACGVRFMGLLSGVVSLAECRWCGRDTGRGVSLALRRPIVSHEVSASTGVAEVWECG